MTLEEMIRYLQYGKTFNPAAEEAIIAALKAGQAMRDAWSTDYEEPAQAWDAATAKEVNIG